LSKSGETVMAALRKVEKSKGILGEAVPVNLNAVRESVDGGRTQHMNLLGAAAALGQNARHFRKIIDALPAAIYATDAEGRLTHFNQAAVELSGRVPELGTDHWCVTWKLYYPDGKPMRHDECPMAVCLRERRSILDAEAIAERPDGTRFWFQPYPTPLFDESGNLIGGINMLVDITERKNAEAQIQSDADALTKLNELSSRLWAMRGLREGLDEMLAATIEMVGADFGNIQILNVNRGALTIVAQRGFKQEFLDFFREVLASDDSACGRALRSGERIIVEDVDMDAPFAPMLDIIRTAGYRAVVTTPLSGRGGKPLGMISTHFRSVHRPSEPELHRLDLYARQASDFIERCRADEDLKQAREAAENANRVKDEFLANVSHELRTPLNAIMGWTHLLTRGKLDEETSARGLETIARNASAQNQLISDLLDVSRIISGQLRFESGVVDLIRVIDAATETVRPAADARGIVLELKLEQGAGLVSGDSMRLQQIIWNLLSNAVKFTPRGGRITVGLKREYSSVVIVVSDTGEGISAEFLPYIFDRFRQAECTSKRQHSGLGLGLAIVRHLVEAHGGTICASSKGLGKGATFTVTFPLLAVHRDGSDAERALFPAGSAISAPPEMLKGLRVLVIDDEEDARELLTIALTQSGAEVRTAATARAALDILDQWKPNILVSDIGMPGEDGYDLIRTVRALESESGGTIPALALTGYASAEDAARARVAGYGTHMAKPVAPGDLVVAVASLIAESSVNEKSA
jgi:PAS domain S-box-containing protein